MGILGQGHQALGCYIATWELGGDVEGRGGGGCTSSGVGSPECQRALRLCSHETRQHSEAYLSVAKVCLLGILFYFFS